MELQELEQFGANITERITEIKRKTDGVIGTHPIEFRGKAEKLPVIRVRIGFPVYRLNNGRTSTYQLEYLALRPDLPEDFFKRDNDAIIDRKAIYIISERSEDTSLAAKGGIIDLCNESCYNHKKRGCANERKQTCRYFHGLLRSNNKPRNRLKIKARIGYLKSNRAFRHVDRRKYPRGKLRTGQERFYFQD